MNEKNNQNMNLEINTRGGILRTISDAIYSSLTDKIREIAANSFDAQSDLIVMTIDTDKRLLSFLDNGQGMTTTTIQDIFNSLGYGLKKEDPTKMSHFGLGLISILQLAEEKAYFYSKAINNNPILVEVTTKELFSKENEEMELSKFGKFIKLIKDKDELRNILIKYSKLNKVRERLNKKEYKFDSFTELILPGVSDNDLETVLKKDFEENIGIILPLSIDPEDKFFYKIRNVTLRNKIIEFFDDENLCPKMDFYIFNEKELKNAKENSTNDKTERKVGLFKQIFKYFYNFSNLNSIDTENLFIIEKKNYRAYAITKVNDLYKEDEEKKSYGFTLRNRNFLVKTDEFFDYPFLKELKVKTIQSALRTWVFGEIYHRDFNYMIKVSRKEIKEEDKDLQDFVKDFLTYFSNLNDILRNAYNNRKKIRDDVLEPIDRIINGDIFTKVEETVRIFSGEESRFKENSEKIIKSLKSAKKEKWMVEEKYHLDNILSKSKEIEFETEEMKIVVSDKPLMEKTTEFIVPITGGKPTFKISSEYFKSKNIDFLGKSFDLKFIYLGDDAPSAGVINYNITDKRNEILINIFNENVKLYKIDIIEMYLLIDVAYNFASSKDDMRDYLVKYLEKTSDTSYELINNFSKMLSLKAKI